MTDQRAVGCGPDCCTAPAYEPRRNLAHPVPASSLGASEHPIDREHKGFLWPVAQNGYRSTEYGLFLLAVVSVGVAAASLLGQESTWDQTLETILFWSLAVFCSSSPIDQIDNARTLSGFVAMLLVFGVLVIRYLESQRGGRT